nr:hypothetical protein [Tanacetum cinerariifolium]
MANLSKDIQCADLDSRPPMLDRTDFASWQQRIYLYCRGKENGVNILKSIDERPFQMGMFRETLAAGEEGAFHLGPKRPRVYSDLSPEEKDRFVTAVKLNRWLRESNYDQLYTYLKQHKAHTNVNKMMLDQFTQNTVDPIALMSNVSHQQYYSQSSITLPSTYVQPHFADNTQLDLGLSPTDNLIKDLTNTLTLLNNHTKHTFLKQTINSELHQIQRTKPRFKRARLLFRMFRVDKIEVRGTMHGVHVRLVMRELITEWGMQIQENGVALDEEQLLFIAGRQDNVVDEDVDEQPVQDLALNVDNVFQVNDCDAFDSDVDEAPTAQTMFMANLSSVDVVYDEPDPSYDSDILSKVHDHDHYHDAVCEHHEVHEMHDDLQPNYVLDSHTDYTSDSNMILYDQYVKDNAVPVVQSNVSSIPNDAYMMILNDMYEQPAQHVSVTIQNKVVDNSLSAELATYKEQVELYERRAKFELTEREQKIDEQLRIVITDRNIKEGNLKKNFIL